MKTIISYCKLCRDNTYHIHERGFSPAHTDTLTKVFFTVGTLGFGALAMSNYLTCTRCSLLTEK